MRVLELIIVKLLEALAVTACIYLIFKQKFEINSVLITLLSIWGILIAIDFGAPLISNGLRQGTGFGLGFAQIAGSPLPQQYFDPNKQLEPNMTQVDTSGPSSIEGYDPTQMHALVTPN